MVRFFPIIILLLVALGCNRSSPVRGGDGANATNPNKSPIGHWVDDTERKKPYSELCLLADGRGAIIGHGLDDSIGIQFTTRQSGDSKTTECAPGPFSDGASTFTLTPAANGKMQLQGDDFDDTLFVKIADNVPDPVIEDYFAD